MRFLEGLAACLGLLALVAVTGARAQETTPEAVHAAMAKAQELRKEGKLVEAQAAFLAAAEQARASEWPQLEGEARYEAGRDAYNRKAFDEAIALEEEALALYRQAGDTEREAWLLSSVGMCQIQLGRPDRARACYLDARRVAGEHDHPAGAGRAALLLGDLDHASGALDEAARWYRLAAEENGRADAPQLVAMALFNRATCLAQASKIDEALAAYAEAGEYAEAKGLPDYLMAWLNRAAFLQRHGRIAEAVAEYDRLLPLSRQSPNPAFEGHIERNLYFGHRSLMQTEKALGHGLRAILIHERLGDRRTATFLRSEVALSLVDLLRMEEALALAERAVQDARTGGNPQDIATTLLSRANVRQQEGDYVGGAADYQEAAQQAHAANDDETRGLALAGLGTMRERQGRYAEALGILDEAVTLCRRAGNRRGVARASHARGNALWGLHEFDESEAAYEESLACYEAIHERLAAIGTQRNLAGMLSAQGKLDEAQVELARANDDLDAQPPGSRAWGLSMEGHLLTRLGRYEEAEEKLHEALRDEDQLPLSLRAALTADRGFLDANAGRSEQAAAHYRKAAELHERLGEPWELASDLNMLARLEGSRGRPHEALAAARRSTETRLAIGRGLPAGEKLALAAMAREAEDAGLLALLDLRKAGHEADAREALWFVETGRALLLLEELVNRDELLAAHVEPDLLEGEDHAALDLRRARQTLLALLQRSEAATEDIATAETAFRRAETRLEEARGAIRRASSRVAQIAYPRPVEPEALSDLLHTDEALLLYHVFGDGGVAVVVARKDDLAFVDLGGEDVRDDVDAWLRLLSTPGSDDRALAAKLHERLIARIEVEFEGVRRLLIGPDDRLAFLPFEALLTSDADTPVRLVERYEVAYVPSATVLAELRRAKGTQRRGRGLVALGDPAYDVTPPGPRPGPASLAMRGLGELTRLPFSGEEVRDVAALYAEEDVTVLVREQASRDGLLAALPEGSGRLAALHLACHGSFVPEHPQLSGLVLADRDVLTVGDLYAQDVRADLAVLSACESGLGPIQRGEGVVGLVRAFLFAGTPRVIVTNWNVQDAGTKDLMVDLHRRLRDGATAAEALRETKRAALRAGGDHAHPYHWAAPVLWGSPDP